MKIKRWLIVLIGIFIIITIIAVVYKLKIKNTDNIIQPEEEISEEEERRTLVTLFFKSKVTNKLEPEVQLVDVKELVKSPYEVLVNLLIKGPKNDVMERLLPENTKINGINIEGDKLIIDFSEEFIKDHKEGEEDEKLTIDSLVNTLTELTEVNSIKILINGEENRGFNDGKIMFNAEFSRED